MIWRAGAVAIVALLLLASTATEGRAQRAGRGVPRFSIDAGPLLLRGPVRPGAFLADPGRRAAILGDETGTFEVWAWPLKLIGELELAFQLPGRGEPIAGSDVARHVRVRPAGTTVVYSHAAFTVKEHVFTPLDEPGALVLLDVDAVEPLEIHVRMRPDFGLAWPGAVGADTVAWSPEQRAFRHVRLGSPPAYGLVGSPAADTAGAGRFVIRHDPARATGEFIAVAAAGGLMSRDSVAVVYRRLLAEAPRYWTEKVAYYRSVRDELLAVRSPDARLDRALEWAKVNLHQQMACTPGLGCGLLGGFDAAGPGGFRPGRGGYFGSDAALGSLALDAVGAFDAAREALTFLAEHQRTDGRIPHAVSHAADATPWFDTYPDAWLHGTSTPLWILACAEYWKASGDEAFVRRYWTSLIRAFRWAAATDTDGDGLMDAAAGAGAVESGALREELHTDIYLAGLWVAALDGMRSMARAVGDELVARDADALYRNAQRSLENGFWMEESGRYAFGVTASDTGASPREIGPTANGPAAPAGGGVIAALTPWPTAAMALGVLDAERSDRMLRQLGSSVVTADWGVRTLARDHRLYDPLRAGYGAVGAVMNGFTALAHYRHHRAWAGFDLLQDAAGWTFDFARGRMPGSLSGSFYQAPAEAAPQDFGAAAMLVTPTVRGLLGLEPRAAEPGLTLAPHLPATWDRMEVRNLRVGRDRIGVRIRREAGRYSVRLTRATAGEADDSIAVRLAPALPLGATIEEIAVNGRVVPVKIERSDHDVHPIVEMNLRREAIVHVVYSGGVEVVTPTEVLESGQRSRGLRVLDFRRTGETYRMVVEGRAGATYSLRLRSTASLEGLAGAAVEQRDGSMTTLRIPLRGDAPGTVRAVVLFRTRG